MDSLDFTKYNKSEHTLTALNGNLIALGIAIPTLLLFGTPFYLLWGNPLKEIKEAISGGIVNVIINLAIFIVGIVLHEFIHGITWAIFAKNGMKSIRFGIVAASLTPYCHCKEVLTSGQYNTGAIMPAIITGFLPTIIAIIIGNPIILVFGIIFTIAASGDLTMMWMLRKEKNTLIEDHPTKIGYIVYKEHEKAIDNG